MYHHGKTGPRVFIYYGNIIARRNSCQFYADNMMIKKPRRDQCNQERLFQTLFGCSPDITAEIWHRITSLKRGQILEAGAKPYHLLWALLFMKIYANDDVLCSMAGGVDSKTFRLWRRYFINLIADRVFPLEVRIEYTR